jgi:hypothetical protein
VWARNLTSGDIAVALYNEEDTAAPIGFTLASLGWPSGTPAVVRDLWAHTNNGTITVSFGPMIVEPHQTILLRLSKP